MRNKFIDDIRLFEADNPKSRNLQNLINLNFMEFLGKTKMVGRFDLPYVVSKLTTYPDFIALYREPNKYNFTPRTCVAFYEYDRNFDGIHGLWNAIYFNLEKQKNLFQYRFTDVKYFIAPDYSLCGDIPLIENIHRVFRSRIVSIWLTMTLGKQVIPNITYSKF